MARTDEGTWDLAVSVGATVTVLDVERASASRLPNAPFRDPFAEPLVSVCRRLAKFMERPAIQPLPLTCSWRWMMPERSSLASDPASACLSTLCRTVGLPRTHRAVGDMIVPGRESGMFARIAPGAGAQ